jgi:cysteinyl-tRNA synthetase
MITINGQKMARSKNNFITLEELFAGTHSLLEKAFSPMTIRFYMLQAHYGSPVDFSNEALKAAEQGLARLLKGIDVLNKLKPSTTSSVDVSDLMEQTYEAMSDDLNTPIALGYLFEGIRIVNTVNDGKATLSSADLALTKNFMHTFAFEIFGLSTEKNVSDDSSLTDRLVQLLLEQRQQAKARKDYTSSDHIRDQLSALGIIVKDTKEGPTWEKEAK